MMMAGPQGPCRGPASAAAGPGHLPDLLDVQLHHVVLGSGQELYFLRKLKISGLKINTFYRRKTTTTTG